MEMLWIVLSCTLLAQAIAMPRGPGFSLAQLQKELSNADASESSGQVQKMGELESLHVVGVTTHPSDDSKLIYADETALYEFNKATGESIRVAGGDSTGLISHRESADGVGMDAKFKYITKILTRETGVYIFDFDTLRKFSVENKNVETVVSLYEVDWSEKNPTTGTVTADEDLVYFTTIEGYGHFVMSMSIPDGNPMEAEFVSAGPTLIGSLELSADEKYLFLGDVDLKTVVRVDIEKGVEEFFMEENNKFYPGALLSFGDNEVLALNSETDKLEVYDFTSSSAAPQPLCDSQCTSQIKNPLAMTLDREDNRLYIIEGSSHPTLPTYKFAIKEIRLDGSSTAEATTVQPINNQYSNMMKLYSRWLSRHIRPSEN